ncbi:MAG: ribosome small subunit-dependent GTPase A [Planctomycetes bacterium]|nr:ribosome small subunit-dependent GTPase A [Planctomycetota bacterium]
MDLRELGWNRFFEEHFTDHKQKGLVPARVIREHKHIYQVHTEDGPLTAALAGKIDYDAQTKADYPTVGDWVAVKLIPNEDKAVIRAILPRKSKFTRKSVAKADEEQVIAVNIETVFLVTAFDEDFNLRRIERYLVLAWDSGADPVIILNKSDLCDDVEYYISQIKFVAPDVPIHTICATEGKGIEPLFEYLGSGKTVSLLGSSGVGKSTIINTILGIERLAVAPVREDDSKGRHTTTHRELILLPQGGAMIDNPGMRQLHLWVDQDGIKRAFEDIELLAENCKFRDCTHDHEPGCAVLEALEEGKIDPQRIENFQKLKDEIHLLERRQEQNRKAKEIARQRKKINKTNKSNKKKKKKKRKKK